MSFNEANAKVCLKGADKLPAFITGYGSENHSRGVLAKDSHDVGLQPVAQHSLAGIPLLLVPIIVLSICVYVVHYRRIEQVVNPLDS